MANTLKPQLNNLMTFGTKQALLGVCFVGLLAGPLAFRERLATNAATISNQDAIERYGLSLKESAAAAGIDFVHVRPRVDEKLRNIEPQISSMGASVSVVDYNNDGWNDLYVTSSGPGSANRLYENQKNGRFKDVAADVGLADLNQPGTGASMGSVWADYDNDGFEDLFLYKWGRPELFHNDGGKKFTRVTEKSGLPAWANAGSATWFDYDRDGRVDLLICGYWPDDVRLEAIQNTRIMPESFEYANNGGRNWLLRNMGDGKFEDITKEAGLTSKRWTLAVIAADFNNDNETDLFISNDYGMSELYLNEVTSAGRRFRELGYDSGIGRNPKSGMNASIGDVLNSGVHAIYESNISEEGVLIQGNNLWMPIAPGVPRFNNMASVMGVELGGWSFGAQFGDLNNDGFVDLYLVNGYVTGQKGTSYWYDFSEITGGHSRIISDAKNWPAMEGRSLAGSQQKKLWLNGGDGKFVEVAQAVGAKDTYDGRSIALADLENRGVLDVIVANQGGPLLLYRNEVKPGRDWIAFELEGESSNRSALGAQVRVRWKGQEQLQEVVAASGYSAQNQRRLHFGLGENAKVDTVAIRWPSGRQQTINAPAINTIHRIKESQ
jgi:hypothetical protein